MYSTLSFDASDAGHLIRGTSSPRAAPKARRQQVARACNNCRAFRVKCDNEQPCRNCRRKGRQCDQEGSVEVRTFASAVREIDRLNKRVQELEELLRTGAVIKDSPSPSSRGTPKGNTFLPLNLDPRVEHGGNVSSWDCVQVPTRVGSTQCYGPASIFYFIARMNHYLTTAKWTSIALGNEVVPLADRLDKLSNTEFESDVEHMAGPINRIYMERAYEEFYLNIFYEEYHSLYPVIEEASFWNYHRSVWDRSQKFRKPSPLIDIMLAMCLQHGTRTAHADGRPHALADKSDEIIASRWFYRRCQSLLTSQLETPSIMTLQCHMLCVIYLSNANCRNAAHSILAIAIRAGIILGLHLEPPEHLPAQQREARKRLWWMLYVIEMKFAMELGRPLAVNISQVTCSLPSDEVIAYTSVQQMTTLSKEAAYLSFSVHFVRLMLATRAVYVTFYDKCANVLGQKKQKSLYEMPQALDVCAKYLESKMQYVQVWLKEVPRTLKTRRENSGTSYSTHGTRLYLDANLPRWQQQQSVFLELCYHNMMMNLYRPFICFPPPPVSQCPATDKCAEKCLAHALSVTAIVHQVLTETRLLENHQEVFRWQWNATLSLIGYMIAYPSSAHTPKVEQAVRVAIQIFKCLADCFAIAVLAEQTTEELLTRVSIARRPDNSPLLSDVEPALDQIDPRLISDYGPFATSIGMLGDGTGDRFAWGQNLVHDDFFSSMGSSSGHSKIGSVSAGNNNGMLSWTGGGLGLGEDDELLRLLNGMEYNMADEANAMLDAAP